MCSQEAPQTAGYCHLDQNVLSGVTGKMLTRVTHHPDGVQV